MKVKADFMLQNFGGANTAQEVSMLHVLYCPDKLQESRRKGERVKTRFDLIFDDCVSVTAYFDLHLYFKLGVLHFHILF